MARSIKLVIDLDGASGAVSGIRSVEGSVVDLRKTAEKEGPRFNRVMENALGFVTAQVVDDIRARLMAIPGAIVSTGSAIQDQLADLSAITEIAGDDLERLGNTAVHESIRTGTAAVDQIEAYKLLASNIDIAAIGGIAGLEKLGKEVVTLSKGAKIDLATAANVVANSLNQWQESADQSARFINVLAAGAQKGAAEVDDLGSALKESGTTAAQAGIDIEVAVAAIEILGQNALKGSQAGTGLRNVITILRTEAAKLAKFGIKDVNLESDGLVNTLIKLEPLLGDAAGMAQVFGRENLNAASILIQNAQAVGEMTEAVTGTNVAQEQAATQMNTFSGAVARLTALMDSLSENVFDLVDDSMVALIDTSIAFVELMRESGDEAAVVAKAVGVLAVAVGTYTVASKAATLATSAQLLVTRAWRAVVAAVELILWKATAAQIALTNAMRTNPWGLALSAVAAVASAMLIFRDNTSDATEEIEEQREKVQGLTKDIEKLQGAQLLGRRNELKAQLDDLESGLMGIIQQRESMALRIRLSQQREGDGHRELAALDEKRLATQKRILEVRDAIDQAEARGADSLEFRRAVLQQQVDALVDQGMETAELIEKRKELAKVEAEIEALRTGGSGSGGGLSTDEAAKIRKRELQRRALELELMEESTEKRLAAIELAIDQEVEKYREEYGEQFPALFEELAAKLEAEKEKMRNAVTSAGSGAVQVPVKVALDVQLSEEEIDFSFLDDAMRPLDGSISAVNHNLAVLRERYLEAQSASERWQIRGQIVDMENAADEMTNMQSRIQTLATTGADMFSMLGQSIGESMATGQSAIESIARSVNKMLADMAVQLGKSLLAQAAALAILSPGRAARLAVAGTGLIVLGSALGAAASRQGRESGTGSSAATGRLVETTSGEYEWQAYRDGGLVQGPGSSRSDSIPAWLSNGEFVVNARATREHYPLLSSINAGAVVASMNSRRAGDRGINQRELEEAVAKAVVAGVKRIPLEASGRSLKTVAARQQEIDSWAGKI